MTRRGPRAFVVGLAVASLLTIAACGSRGPLDVGFIEVEADAGVTFDAAQDASTDARDANVFDCAACFGLQCGGDVLECLQTPACMATLQCAAMTCLAAGDTSPACLLKCGSDPAGALGIFNIVTCLTGTCGADCASVLGPLGSVGGLGGMPLPGPGRRGGASPGG